MLLIVHVLKVGTYLIGTEKLTDIQVCSMDIMLQELAIRMKENIQTSLSLHFPPDCSGPWCILAKYIHCFKQPCLLFLCPYIPICKIFSKGI